MCGLNCGEPVACKNGFPRSSEVSYSSVPCDVVSLFIRKGSLSSPLGEYSSGIIRIPASNFIVLIAPFLGAPLLSDPNTAVTSANETPDSRAITDGDNAFWPLASSIILLRCLFVHDDAPNMFQPDGTLALVSPCQYSILPPLPLRQAIEPGSFCRLLFCLCF